MRKLACSGPVLGTFVAYRAIRGATVRPLMKQGGEHMWNWMHGGGWGYGMLWMGLLWVVVVVALVSFVRMAWDRAPRLAAHGRNPEGPVEILQRRYARGEIDRAEYEQKRRDLSPPADSIDGNQVP
jgi:putative membrane protein